MGKRFEVHSHTDFSNIRLLDCIHKPSALIDAAYKQGLAGIAITDHECLSAHASVDQLKSKYPDFKIVFGNEIYLCKTREPKQKYYHFILLARNKTGYKALRELSTRAWLNSFTDRKIERVVTLYTDLEEILHKYPNSLIGTTACLGGQLSTLTKQLIKAESNQDAVKVTSLKEEIVNFMTWAIDLFGDNFYIECAPGCSEDQIIVNKRLRSIATAFGRKMVIGTDAHYLTEADRPIHTAYLNSKDGDRETESFYLYSYLQDEETIYKNLAQSDYETEFIDEMFDNSIEILNKIEEYSLFHKQQIPKVKVPQYPKQIKPRWEERIAAKPTLKELFLGDDDVGRYWVNQCCEKLEEWEKFDDDVYLSRLEEEARVKKVISGKLETNMFSYPVTLQHYINLIWETGSLIGAGRGSSCSGLNHALLNITQLDPIEWGFPFWRYLNDDREEIGDIDVDICPSKRPAILRAIKKERAQNFKEVYTPREQEELGCTLVATFGTEGTKSSVLTAARGYRSEEYPSGIDVDKAQYIASLIPSERGFLWPLKDVVYGNEEKSRKPVRLFIEEVNKYPRLLDIMMSIEGLVNKRSSHASGVIMTDEDPYEFCAFMRTPTGEVITQYDLHGSEYLGATKYDFLVTTVQDKLLKAIELLQEDGAIEPELSLKEVYDKYFHPSKLPIDDLKYWQQLHENKVINVFQFESEVGKQAAKSIKPTSISELTDANSLMRLMGEKGSELPMDKYIRFKNDISLWYKEMDEAGLTKAEQEALKPYFASSYGVPPTQEQLMQMLMDKNICGFTLAEANAARKVVGKKIMAKIPELRAKVISQAKSPALGEYVWRNGAGPQMGYAFSVV